MDGETNGIQETTQGAVGPLLHVVDGEDGDELLLAMLLWGLPLEEDCPDRSLVRLTEEGDGPLVT